MMERSKGSPSGSNRAAWPTEKTCVLSTSTSATRWNEGLGVVGTRV
jgi:hypothetical protein